GRVTNPVTLDLVSTSAHSSFAFNPSAATQTNFSNWTGPMPDGIWSVQMKYTDSSHVTFPSSTILQVQTSTQTLPATLTGPAAGPTTNAATVPVSFPLPSTPNPASRPTLTFLNTGTSAASVLTLASNATTGSFSLDPTNLAVSSAVLSVTGPTALADGAYN